jgi:hypothetical protein
VRNAAIRALRTWPPETWPDEAAHALIEALWREPHDTTKQSIREALATT